MLISIGQLHVLATSQVAACLKKTNIKDNSIIVHFKTV